MIYLLPIEPLEERYSEQWYRWFPEVLEERGARFTVIDGEPLTDTVETGTFLDVNSTLHYKATQLQRVAKLFYENKIQPDDVFFVADIEFWGIESIRYLSVLNGIDVKIYGFAHAGSYTREDFMEPCAPFARWYEVGWGAICDLIMVGSEYHKKQLIDNRGISENKILVTGNPYKSSEVCEGARWFPGAEKKKLVVHTNRPDPEKRPEHTLDAFAWLHRQHPDWEFAVTTSRKMWAGGPLRNRAKRYEQEGWLTVYEGLSKKEYLKILSEAQVMTGNSIEENFGYCILEALIFDTIPIVEDAYSHSELLCGEERCLFTTRPHQLELIEQAMAVPFPVRQMASRYDDSLQGICDVLVEGTL